MIRLFVAALLCMCVSLPALAQEAETTSPPIDRSATGGAQTLEDILARQRGEPVAPRGDATLDDSTAAGMAGQLGTLGGPSDSEVWRALRYGHDSVSVSAGGDYARVLMQDGGMKWQEFRQTTLATWGGYLLLGTLGALLLFYLLRGRVAVDAPMTGRTVTRFKSFERFSHWLLAGSFIVLGISGLLVLFGRTLIVPTFGHEVNSYLLIGSKFAHNNLAWPFMLAIVFVFFLWVWHNIPNRTDLVWFAQFGGIIGKKHPPAKKFNAGQKIIFWSVILLGGSISMSGLSLLFPFELPLFAKTFGIINDIGLTNLIGMAPLPTELAPHEEMQLAQLWHSIVAFVMMSIIIAHIYIGSVGMQGAYDAMGSGEVDEAWAHQHHSLWLDEIKQKERTAPPAGRGAATPAE
jgi:formate dehydrogenase subunit gamma